MPTEPMKSLTAEWLNNMVHLYRLCLSARLGLFFFFLVVKNYLFQYSSNSAQRSGGSKRDTRDTRPLRSNFFHFHTVFGKKIVRIIGWHSSVGDPGSATAMQ